MIDFYKFARCLPYPFFPTLFLFLLLFGTHEPVFTPKYAGIGRKHTHFNILFFSYSYSFISCSTKMNMNIGFCCLKFHKMCVIRKKIRFEVVWHMCHMYVVLITFSFGSLFCTFSV